MKFTSYLPLSYIPLAYFSTLPHKGTILKMNYNKFIKRSIVSYKNKISTSSLPCPFCRGSGFIVCRHCDYGCWKCDETTMERCPYCNGDGNARYAINPSSVLQE